VAHLKTINKIIHIERQFVEIYEKEPIGYVPHLFGYHVCLNVKNNVSIYTIVIFLKELDMSQVSGNFHNFSHSVNMAATLNITLWIFTAPQVIKLSLSCEDRFPVVLLVTLP